MQTTHAMVVPAIGGPEVFSYEEITLQKPAADEVIVQHRAIGVNFIDTYFRSGLYPWTGDQPIIVGAEASGVITDKGRSVSKLQIGDRVAYTLPNGAYCQHRLIKADRLVKLPDDLSFDVAAAGMLKGLTVHYLLHRTFQVKPGHTLLFHAAAGGVGLLAGQWAAHLGATVIGTVSTAEKAELAKKHGYTHIINYREADFVEKVHELTGGKGVDVVYDSVGRDTYPGSLKCLKRLGHWVSFGQSSGLIGNFDLRHLVQYGSLTATRPRLFDYIVTREELEAAAGSLFEALASFLKVSVHQKFPLREAGKAHTMLENRRTKGSTLLVP